MAVTTVWSWRLKEDRSAFDEEAVEISVKSILSEEEKHLDCINAMLLDDPPLKHLQEQCVAIEANLFNAWLRALAQEVPS